MLHISQNKKDKHMRVHQRLGMALIAMLLVACEQKPATPAGPPAMPPMPVSVISASPATVPISVEAVAQLEGAKEVEIRPRVGGILLKKMFEEGQPIKAGQTMFQIDPEPFRIALTNAKAALAQQSARVTQTQRESSRLKDLLATQSISQREYDNATSDHAIAGAGVMQAQAAVKEAELNLSYTTVAAPSSGVAGRFLLSEGALVAANTSLLTTVVQISPIWVRFSLSESELAQLGGALSEKGVQDVKIILPDGAEYAESGKLNFAASQIDPALGTQQLRAEFANKDKKLLPGQFVRARVTTGTRDGVFLVPQTAVLTGDQGKFVYVAEKGKDGKASVGIRPVKESGWQGGDWVVEGLNAGDQVIVDNIIKLRPGATVAPHPFGTPPPMPAAANQPAGQKH